MHVKVVQIQLGWVWFEKVGRVVDQIRPYTAPTPYHERIRRSEEKSLDSISEEKIHFPITKGRTTELQNSRLTILYQDLTQPHTLL